MLVTPGRQWGKGGLGIRPTLQAVDERRRRGELNDQIARPCLGLGRCHVVPFRARSRHFDHHQKTAIGCLYGKPGLRAAPMAKWAGQMFLDP